MSKSRIRAITPKPVLLILTLLVGMATAEPALALRNVGFVEVSGEASRVVTLRQVPTTLVATVDSGTILEVMDEERDWYWILLDPDLNGVRRAGWIRARDVVERPDLPVMTLATAPRPVQSQGEADAAMPPPSTPPTVESQEITLEAEPDVEVVLNFGFDSADLSPEAQSKLDEMAAQVSADRSAVVEIEGHTDSAGSSTYNQALGVRRAEAVRQYLLEQHQIPLELMNVTSFGEDAPLVPNDTAEGRAQNRRVVIRF